MPSPRFSPQDYESIRTLLGDIKSAHPRLAGKRITLDRLAQRLGYKSPRTIAMIIKGKRAPTLDLVERLAKDLNLTHRAKEHLKRVVALERIYLRDSDGDAGSANADSRPAQVVSPAVFAMIAGWQCYALRQLANTKGFRLDPTWIKARLRHKITESEIRSALELLTKLDLIEDDGKGGIKLKAPNVTFSSEVASKAVQMHHRDMMERAKEALAEQTPDGREFGAVTMAISKADLEAAKLEIRRFRKDFEKSFAKTDADEVYQLNIQFFAHSKGITQGKAANAHS